MEKKRKGCGEATWVTLCCHGTSSSTENQLPTAPLTYLQAPLRSGFPPDSKTGDPCTEIPRSERSRAGLGAGGPPPPPVGSGHPPWEMVLLFPPNTPNQYYLCSPGAEMGNQEPLP